MTENATELNNEEFDIELRFPVILRNTRIDKSIALEDIAKARRLNIKYLEALESGNLDELPQPIFTRGYIRQYAEYLGIDDDPLVDEYNGYLENFCNEPAIPEAIIAKKIEAKNKSQKSFLGSALSFLMIAAITFLAYFIWENVKGTTPDNSSEVSVILPAEDLTVEQRDSALDTMQEEIAKSSLNLVLETDQQVNAAVNDTVNDTVNEEAATETITAESTESLEQRFQLQTNDESWVKVRANNRTIFQGLIKSDNPLDLVLPKPFWIKIGNASSVAMSYEGELVELEPYMKNNVATFVYQ